MEKEKISFGLKKTKYVIVETGREEEELNETVLEVVRKNDGWTMLEKT